jgi:7-cyano-7-deazaguanine synthase
VTTNKPKAVCLLSGGLDSSTAAAIAVARGYEVHALTINYGQRHEREIQAAKAIARHLGVAEHVIIDLDLRQWGGSALTADIDVPKEGGEGIPTTYVPARNTVFLSIALSFAEAIGAEHLFIGVSQVDYSGYPDCREEFVRAFEDLANIGTRAGLEGAAHFKIDAPLINMSKADAIREGLRLGLDYSLTWSCYRGEELACGACDSCRLRLSAFAEAGVSDPIRYVDPVNRPG